MTVPQHKGSFIMSNKSKSDRNEGIIANVVNASAISIGERSQAIVNFGPAQAEQFHDNVTELKRAIETIKFSEEEKSSISKHVRALEEEAKRPLPDRSRVESALKAVKSLGELVSNAKIIIGPVLAIAALFGFTIS